MGIISYLVKIVILSSIGIVVAGIIEETNLLSKIKK
ncbi:nucleoside recognition domain-containing protein [Methanotorris igneus Kol 5]|uniref:Nucleoside recognition domain-containing protein n=1 Tax=Methanotorris igneus (strain DSM 5666 / JCM 11834 / Kol 5) TaxID=880724 RepID=F6BCL9_METIK|nr:nucleoside recognition domain-containing protein [Methanotorris igneus Kol 5]